MIGGVAFGTALVLAPIYISEISTAKIRGRLVSIQQLNIVLGFFAAFLSNYLFNEFNNKLDFLNDLNVWRYMLGIESIPALVYFITLFFVPESPRWLVTKGLNKESAETLGKIYGNEIAKKELKEIEKSIDDKSIDKKYH